MEPTQRRDGSALDDLVSIKLYWGCTRSGRYTDTLTVKPGSAPVVIDTLPNTGSCYFVATAIDSKGVESAFSNEASKIMGPVGQGLPTTPVNRPTVTWSEGDQLPAYEVIVCPDSSATNFPSCPSQTWIDKADPLPTDMVFRATEFTGTYQPPGPTENNHMSGPGNSGDRGWRAWSAISPGEWIAVVVDGWVWYVPKE